MSLWEKVQKHLDSQLECILILKYNLPWVLLPPPVPGEDFGMLFEITGGDCHGELMHFILGLLKDWHEKPQIFL